MQKEEDRRMVIKAEGRQIKNTIDPIHVNRWSTRSFTETQVEDEKIEAIIEAATWAPSAANWQPWHFIVAQTEAERANVVDFLFEGNQIWCQHVPAFIVLTSRKTHEETGNAIHSHSFDAGTAWGYLSQEANRQGLMTHAMSGLDKEKARELLHIPEEYEIEVVIAVGYHDSANTKLTEALIAREVPSTRKPVTSFISKGTF